MANDYRELTHPTFGAVIDRSAERKPMAGVDQGDGTAALLISGSLTAAPTRATGVVVSSVAPSTSAQALVGSNANRAALTIYNGGSGVLYVGLDASVTNIMAQVTPGQTYALAIAYTGSVYGISASTAGGNIVIADYSP